MGSRFRGDSLAFLVVPGTLEFGGQSTDCGWLFIVGGDHWCTQKFELEWWRTGLLFGE